MGINQSVSLEDMQRAFGLYDDCVEQQSGTQSPVIPKVPNKEVETEYFKLLKKSYKKDGLSQQEYNRLMSCVSKLTNYHTQKRTLIHVLEYFCKDPHHMTAEEYLWCIGTIDGDTTASKLQEYADQLSAWYTKVTTPPNEKKRN